MTEVRTRTAEAQSVTPTTVSFDTPEEALFLPETLAEQRFPVDAINCAVARARGVVSCVHYMLENNDFVGRAEVNALWAVIGLLDQIDKLADFAWYVEQGNFKTTSSTSTEDGNHA